jgi:hypothetical protein
MLVSMILHFLCPNDLQKTASKEYNVMQLPNPPQAVSRWLPTAAARARTRVWLSGICGGQTGTVAGFLQVYFGFLCQSSFHQILNSHNHPGQVQ